MLIIHGLINYRGASLLCPLCRCIGIGQASQAFENSRGRGSNVTLLVYDEADALHSLYLAQASYCVTTEWSCPTCVDGVTLTRVIEINQERALVGYDSNTNSLFVAYRGTENPRNWLQNVRFLKTAPYSDLPEVKVEKVVTNALALGAVLRPAVLPRGEPPRPSLLAPPPPSLPRVSTRGTAISRGR